MTAPDITSLLFLDTETNGLDPNKGCCVLEVACARLDLATGQISDTYEALIHGGDAIQGDYHKREGTFRDADWSKAVPRREAIGQLFARMEGSTIAGHNVKFDIKFLRAEADLLKFYWPTTQYHEIDTVAMAAPLLFAKKVSSLSLETLRTWAGRTGKQSHRALGEVMDTIAVFQKMTELVRMGLHTMDAFAE